MMALYSQIDDKKYSKELFQQFVQEMHVKHRFFAYLETKPPKIALRRPADAAKLKKLSNT